MKKKSVDIAVSRWGRFGSLRMLVASRRENSDSQVREMGSSVSVPLQLAQMKKGEDRES